MIPAKAEPAPITLMRETGMEPIVDWFDQHKQSFFILARIYLRDQQQIEEVFYRSILKVHKEVPRFEQDTPLDKRIASIFMEISRELSINGSLPVEEKIDAQPAFLEAFDQLKIDEREALILAYIRGFSHEDTAHIMGVPIEKEQELVFFGIQSLKNVLGYGQNLNGCQEYQKNYLDYLERNMDRPEKIDFEIHIYHCRDCQEDLAAFQDVMLAMKDFAKGMNGVHVPANLMGNVKAKLAERQRGMQLKRKKRIQMGAVLAGIFTLLLGFEILTGSFTGFYYAYAEDDPELRALLQHGLGKPLNLVAESDGVKITIKSAIADDIQTLIYYEIEDTKEARQFMMPFNEGMMVEDQYKIMNENTHPMFYPPELQTDKNKHGKNIFQGKFSLLPLKEEKATIKLNITKLHELIRDDAGEVQNLYSGMDTLTGDWKFEIPVEKKPLAEYEMDEETEIEGIPVRIEKLTIAPTITILDIAFNNGQTEKRMDYVTFDNMEVNRKKLKADLYGTIMRDEEMKWTGFQAHFEPVFEKAPKEIKVQFKSAMLTVEDKLTIKLDSSQSYPQTFEYAGSTISIDRFEAGRPSYVEISNHELRNRQYDLLWLEIMGDYELGTVPIEMSTIGVTVDKNGNEYEQNENINFEKIEQPRYMTKVQTFKLISEDPEEKIIPNRIEMFGYNTTKYLDDVVKISIKK
ncbi:DUF4179 domain-containing protein [Bacillus sp. B-jedd]|uniref:DUF4179 domain-containing protein n=1 Tax=Bacillus sp. B-jedd TaxID=1476857 RepID=UPI0005155939|nr:DUF4179 domain-containing protein [Bacillus sp. B-jedd]CEG25458.1 RNA polymerase sigma factor [Bacillus sp. B-jedd]